MKRLILITVLLFTAAGVSAQNSSVGILVGLAESVDSGIDLDFEEKGQEIFFQTALEPLTTLRLKVGRAETDTSQDVEYLHALIEYRFDEVYGSTGLYMGPGIYRKEVEGESDTDYGVEVGLNGLFPITRRLGFMAQAAYHWTNFSGPDLEFITLSGGLRMSF